MRFSIGLCTLFLICCPVFAQQSQQPDPVLMQQIILRLQQMRNEAYDRAAFAEAKNAQLTQEIDQLKSQLPKPNEEKPK